MQKIELIEEIRYSFKCPWCNEAKFSITHLMGENTNWGPWFCDNCGQSCMGKVKDKEVFIEKRHDRKLEKYYVFLKHDDMLIIVEGRHDGTDNLPYLYDSHTCPTNYLKNIITIVDLKNKDIDPHGIFEYITAIPTKNLNIEQLEHDLNRGLLGIL